MQPQLEEGEFCPPDYPTVICKAGPRVVWVGQRKSGFTGRCSVTMRKGETALTAATRKLGAATGNALGDCGVVALPLLHTPSQRAWLKPRPWLGIGLG